MSHPPAAHAPPPGLDPDASAEHLRRQLQTVADNASLALFIMDEHQHCTFMNRAAEALTGFTLAEVRGRALHDVIHHTRPDGTPYPLHECPIDQAFPRNMREQGEEVFVHCDGHFYPVAFTASPIRDGERTVGTIIEVRDVSEERRRDAERERLLAERERLLRALEHERERLQQIFVRAPALISVTRGPDHVFEMVNPFYERVAGGRELVGKPLREALPELAGQGFFEMRDALYASGETHVQNEARIVADLDGDGEPEEHFLNFVTQPLRDAAGEVDGILTFAVDVTEQVAARRVVEDQAAELEQQTEELQLQATHLEETQVELESANDELQRANRELAARTAQAEQASAEARAAAGRVEVLAEAGAVLGSALDVSTVLGHLARLVVPRLADWCFIEMAGEDGRIEPAAFHHTDPAMVALAEESLRRFPVDPGAPHGTGRVLRTGEPELVADIPDALLEAVARDAEHLAVLRRVGFRSSLSVPLRVRGRAIGVLSLVMSDTGRRFGTADLPLAEELARRTALAVENARLMEAEQTARAEAERAADLSRRLHDIAAALNQAVTPAEVAEVGVRHGSAALRADAGSLALLVDDDTTFELVQTQGFGADLTDRWRRFPFTPGRPLSDAVRLRTPVLLGSRAEWKGEYGWTLADLAEGGTHGFAAAPLVVGGRALGGLTFSFGREREFDDADRVFLATLGEQTAQALERARLLEAEREARREAEVANRAKTEFLSAMSHELRTPLNAIAGYVDLLDLGVHGPLADAQRRDLARIRHAQLVLLGLISDILNFARIEAGRIEFAREPVPLAPLVRGMEDIVDPQVRARGIRYACGDCAPGAVALGDPDRIQQILMNLLSNAVKFTASEGEVRVSCAVAGEQVRVVVADTGRGIAPEKLVSIFEPFVQLNRQGSEESQQGVGLGLAISRELARGMGGEITVESEPGRGSTFTLVLPAALGDGGAA